MYAPSGRWALRLHTTGFTPGCEFPGAYALSPLVAAEAGKTYDVSSWSRNADHAGKVWLIFYNSSGVQLASFSTDLSSDASLFNTDGITGIGKAPSDASHLRIRYDLATPDAYADVDLLLVAKSP
jgi:hypothetical protein